MLSMKKLDNEALHCVCNCWIKNVENLWEATAHLTQFPPEKFPVHTSASQADGVGGGPPPGSDTQNSTHSLMTLNEFFKAGSCRLSSRGVCCLWYTYKRSAVFLNAWCGLDNDGCDGSFTVVWLSPYWSWPAPQLLYGLRPAPGPFPLVGTLKWTDYLASISTRYLLGSIRDILLNLRCKSS